MITEELLSMLRCPVTHERLQVADSAHLERINQAITRRHVKNRLGETVAKPIGEGLINESGTLLYTVEDDIPCLLPDEAIDVGGIA